MFKKMYSAGASPEWREELLKRYIEAVCPDFDWSLFPLDWLKQTDFFTAPASTRYHGAYEGGLFDHSMNVAMALVHMGDKGVTSPWSRKESPIIVGMLHDATKIGLYTRDPETGVYSHSPSWKSIGACHGEDSMFKVKSHVELTEEEAACIRRHMGAYESPEIWDVYDEDIRRFPNVFWTHTADMVASKLLER